MPTVGGGQTAGRNRGGPESSPLTVRKSFPWKGKGYTEQNKGRKGVRWGMTILWLSIVIPSLARALFHFSLHSFTHLLVVYNSTSYTL